MIQQRELTALRRVVKAAEEVTSYCYVHNTRIAFNKMIALRVALNQFNGDKL